MQHKKCHTSAQRHAQTHRSEDFFDKSNCFVYLSNAFDFGREMSGCILQKATTASSSATFSVASSFEATTVAATAGKCTAAAGNGAALSAQAVTQGVLEGRKQYG